MRRTLVICSIASRVCSIHVILLEPTIIGMSLDMFLEILWSFESFATEFTFVRFQWNVNTNVRGDVITLYSGGATAAPCTGQIEIVG